MNPADVRERRVEPPADGPPPPAAVLEQPVPTLLLDGAYAGFDQLTFDVDRGCWGLGTTTSGGSIVLMPSGEVRCFYPATDVFVNSTFSRFDQTIRAVAARYPYYDAAMFDDDDHMQRIKRELFSAVARIDPAAVEDGWWNDLLWDILSGDFGVEAFD